MDNISGSAASWLTEEQKTKKGGTGGKGSNIKELVNIEKEFDELKKLQNKIIKKKIHDKNINDALIMINSAIDSLKQLKN